MDVNSRAHYPFYKAFLSEQLASARIGRTDQVLALAAGSLDKQVLEDCGFANVTLSNLSDEATHAEGWLLLDAEDIALPDNSFDVVIAHAGLHHCASPHRALAEMYRVARRSAIFIEPNDSLVARIGTRFGFGQLFEHAAVVDNDYVAGGLRNSCIPNYVWRWSKREVEKAVVSLDPAFEPSIAYAFGVSLHERTWQSWIRRTAHKAIMTALRAVPSQGNKIGVCISIPGDDTEPVPWLQRAEGELRPNRAYLQQMFGENPKLSGD